MQKARVEAFSDGVIAIAITLLVLEIRIPRKAELAVEKQSLLHALGDQWPSFAAYAVSFVAIGVMWVNHHHLLEDVRIVDRAMLYFNLFLLMGIAFLPFPTALFAEHLRWGGQNSHVAAAIYSLNMVVISVAFGLMRWWMVRDDRLLQPTVDQRLARAGLARFTIGLWVYIGTVGLAFVDAVACLVVHFLLVGYYALDQLRTRDADEASLEGTETAR